MAGNYTDPSQWYKRGGIPPLFGRPKPVKVDTPDYIPSRMWLVHINDSNQQLETLRIQTVPDELEVTPTSNWAVIPSIGRNNAFYHYTGGEDALKFTLDWYAVTANKNEVIEKCRWVESLAKSNAYFTAPPRVVLVFGELYQYDTWIIESAPYRLSLFDRSSSMMPRQAYQELTLKRVTDNNMTTDDIRYSNGKPLFSSIT